MFSLLDVENLTLAIIAAIAAYAMRQLHLAALRAGGASRGSDNAVSATARMSTSTTSLLLRHCHGFPSPYPLDQRIWSKRYISIKSDETKYYQSPWLFASREGEPVEKNTPTRKVFGRSRCARRAIARENPNRTRCLLGRRTDCSFPKKSHPARKHGMRRDLR